MYVKLSYIFLNCYYILATHKNLLYESVNDKKIIELGYRKIS